MEFATYGLKDRLLRELRRGARADIVVAYCNPADDVLAALRKCTQLKLLVADDFRINNPDKLETLHQQGHWVRALAGEWYEGNLHAKVYLVTRKSDESVWAMIGSANLTRPGLDDNHEACIILDSRHPEDQGEILKIRKWVKELQGWGYDPIDFAEARAIFNAGAKAPGTSKRAPPPRDSKLIAGSGFWAIKPGYCGKYWNRFLSHGVVAIGWGEVGDASKMTKARITERYWDEWPDCEPGSVPVNVAQIIKFTRAMGDDDLVLLCGRLDTTHGDKAFYIHGIGRTLPVGSTSYHYVPRTNWYRFRRHATIQPIRQYLPGKLVAQALNVWSIVPTIQELDQPGFSRLIQLIHRELGVVVTV